MKTKSNLKATRTAMSHKQTRNAGTSTLFDSELAVDKGDREAAVAPTPIPNADTTMSPAMLLPPSGTTLVVPPPTTQPQAPDPQASVPSTATSIVSMEQPVGVLQLTTTVWIPAPTSSSAQAKQSNSNDQSGSHSSFPLHLSVVMIVLIAVGSVALLLSIFIFFKCVVVKGRRKSRPTPSAPILQESPLFGPKERFSTRLWMRGSNNLSASGSNRAGIGMGPGKGDGWKNLEDEADMYPEKSGFDEKFDYESTTATAINAVPVVTRVPVPLTSHFSPESLYPSTPQTNIGLALDWPLPVKPLEDVQPLKVRDKSAEDRSKRRQSMITKPSYVVDMSPSATDFQTPRPAPTPGMPKPVLKKTVSSGREKIRKPYSNNIAPQSKSSSMLHRLSTQGDPFIYAVPTVKSSERRDRDTKALTSALGLASPAIPASAAGLSPSSIYPDDSLSVVYGRNAHSGVPSEMPSPGKMHAALGSLMFNGFPTESTRTLVGREHPGGPVSDKPPRVPSPPPLPSLAQMAMENADADYRSPTYSIYGLYEAQRKANPLSGEYR